MNRILSAILLVFFALALATPAQADRGDKSRGWRDQDRQQSDNGDYRPGKGRRDSDRPSANERRRDDQDGDRKYDNRRRNNDGRPLYGRRREHDRARDGVMGGRMISLEELEKKIARRTPGYRIGNPEFLLFGGRPVYRIRWRTPDGHILIVFADAETGQVIDIRGR